MFSLLPYINCQLTASWWHESLSPVKQWILFFTYSACFRVKKVIYITLLHIAFCRGIDSFNKCILRFYLYWNIFTSSSFLKLCFNWEFGECALLPMFSWTLKMFSRPGPRPDSCGILVEDFLDSETYHLIILPFDLRERRRGWTQREIDGGRGRMVNSKLYFSDFFSPWELVSWKKKVRL